MKSSVKGSQDTPYCVRLELSAALDFAQGVKGAVIHREGGK
jgi:hypothetical protein